jgi:hypothetical protein
MQSITDAYMEYDFLSQSLTDLENNQVTTENIYEKIMEKEENAINLMNRVAEEKLKNKEKSNTFLNLTIKEIFTVSIIKWLMIYNEVVNFKNYDLKKVFYDGDRKIYVGVMLIIIALILFFAEISN